MPSPWGLSRILHWGMPRWRWILIIGVVGTFNLILLLKLNSQQVNISQQHIEHRTPGPVLQPVVHRKRSDGLQLDHPKEPILLRKQARKGPDQPVIPVVVAACNRPTVARCLDGVLRYRSDAKKFPVIVSMDCGHAPTINVVNKYKGQVEMIRQPNQTDIKLQGKLRRFVGYYKISRHFKWFLDEIFIRRGHNATIILEDDLDVAPDFFEYFTATFPVLRDDPSLWCVSAWNDNGKSHLVAQEPQTLFRTDFFPGLGWMMMKNVWLELREKWPLAFWDDFMRTDKVRRQRACIRPELSRTATFGRKGVSNGQHFDKHLRFIRLNSQYFDFRKVDLTYLDQKEYDARWHQMVYLSSPLVSLEDIKKGRTGQVATMRIEYNSQVDFVAATRFFGAMEDSKSGVPRTAYQGVVPVMYKGIRVYIAPPLGWKAYSTTWKEG